MELTQTAAESIVTQLSDLSIQPLELSPEESDRLRAALLFLRSHSEYQILGICANDLGQAVKALETYSQAFEMTVPNGLIDSLTEEVRSQIKSSGGVYLKFNAQKHTLHTDAYLGNHRGVLVSYQSSFAEDCQGTYGHFPLNLFSR